MQPTTALLNKSLAALIAADAPLDPATTQVGVGTAVTVKGVNTTLADITPATGGMAALKPITTWSAVYNLNNGAPVVDSPVISFAPAAAEDSGALACWYLTDSASPANLLAFGVIVPPVPLPNPNFAWNIVVRVTLDPNGVWSAEVTFGP